jgi:chromosomal replication initiator protein
MAEEPGAAHNPLFIYGPHGVGKTHLLQAIGNDAYSRGGSGVLCVSATLFENTEVATKLVSPDSMGRLRLLLIDDLQQIAGVNGREAQRWLAALIEGMLAAGKGVVVTATQPPDAMLALRDDLLSRLRQDMVVALELPDVEMKVRLLVSLAERSRKSVDQRALQLLASSRNNLAALVSLWERVIARCGQTAVQDAHKQTNVLTAQDIQAVLTGSGPEVDLRSRVGPERIIDQVASYFDLETNEISSSSRERRVMFPRQIAMYLVREQTDSSYEWIAHRFARQDHTTAMHSCARIEELSASDPEVRQTVLELRQMIFGEHECQSSFAVAG